MWNSCLNRMSKVCFQNGVNISLFSNWIIYSEKFNGTENHERLHKVFEGVGTISKWTTGSKTIPQWLEVQKLKQFSILFSSVSFNWIEPYFKVWIGNQKVRRPRVVSRLINNAFECKYGRVIWTVSVKIRKVIAVICNCAWNLDPSPFTENKIVDQTRLISYEGSQISSSAAKSVAAVLWDSKHNNFEWFLGNGSKKLLEQTFLMHWIK